jgi:hypothetical protein
VADGHRHTLEPEQDRGALSMPVLVTGAAGFIGSITTMSFQGCAGTGRLIEYRHDGFWKPAGTSKERAELDASYRNGIRPWAVWESADHPTVAR